MAIATPTKVGAEEVVAKTAGTEREGRESRAGQGRAHLHGPPWVADGQSEEGLCVTCTGVMML